MNPGTKLVTAPAAHVFIDTSNVFRGAQRAAARFEAAAPVSSVRAYYPNLIRLVERNSQEAGIPVMTRVMAGPVLSDDNILWEYLSKHQYEVDLLHKIRLANGHLAEQAVDELLHLKIANVLLDFPPGVLVLVTGDGAVSRWGTSFPKQMERALHLGWHVDVWSWESSLSSRFAQVKVPSGASRTIHEFDLWYWALTFVNAGDHAIAGGVVRLGGRVVSPLQFGLVEPDGMRSVSRGAGKYVVPVPEARKRGRRLSGSVR